MRQLTVAFSLLALLVGCDKQAPATNNKADVSGFDSKEKADGSDKEAAASQPEHRDGDLGKADSSRDMPAKPNSEEQKPQAAQKKPAKEEDCTAPLKLDHKTAFLSSYTGYVR